MKTKRLKFKTGKRSLLIIVIALGLGMVPQNSFAHCDSYDGPVITDALKALENNDPDLVMKWIDAKHEKEITDLFSKTLKYKSEDQEVYSHLEKHFLETLVRVHREGGPYTGLKPAGSTEQIIKLTDIALAENDFDGFLLKFNEQVDKILNEKYEKVAQLKKVNDQSDQKGREYVAAYVNYTHTIKKLHELLEHTGGALDQH